MERSLLLSLLLLAALLGSVGAILRPGMFRIGQDGIPATSCGVTHGVAVRSGCQQPQRPSSDWSRFQGRGPDGAK